MRIWIRRKPVVVGPEVVEKIRDYKGKDYRDGGSIEGRLVGIHEGPGPLHIKVKDVLVARPVKCFIPEAMLKDAFKYFRRRVEVEGLIHYRHDGEIISIQAEEMRVMPERHELPPIESFIGILADR